MTAHIVAFYILLPGACLFAFILGLLTQNLQLMGLSAAMFVAFGLTALMKSGDATAIVNWAAPVWIKIIIGVFVAVVAGAILRILFGR